VDLARRIHAYLFKRGLERMGEGAAPMSFEALTPPEMEHFHPELACAQWLACPADAVLEELVPRAERRRGGMVAVIAYRGMGKTTLLRTPKC
jgi:hypothetical protein